MIFVWTAQDVVGAIFFGAIALIFGLIGVLMLVEKLKRKWTTWRAKP